MSSLRTRALVAVLGASLLVPAALAPAAGYVEQRDLRISLSGPSRVKCTKKVVITATVTRLKNGKVVPNQTINWSLVKRQSPLDRVFPSRSTTNRKGVAIVKLKFGPKAGKRIVRARMPGLKPTITVRCVGGLS